MTEWLGRQSCNLVVPGSSPSSCYSLGLFSVLPSSTPCLTLLNSLLVCLWEDETFKHYVCSQCLFLIWLALKRQIGEVVN